MTRPEHAVLASPVPLEADLEWIDTPDVFRKSKPSIGDRLPTYRIFPTGQPIGGVMTTHIDFEDAPDAESIAGGVHSRHPDSPVIARHGAYVLWGFEGTPDRMTETGRRLLLNVIAYAHAHRGAKPVVKVLTRAREYSQRPEAERPFLYSPDGRKLALDEIARRHGVANDSIEFLRMIGRRLESDPHDGDAVTLVQRYCPEAPRTGFAAWLAAREDDLFFSDWGGYRWFSRREILRQSLPQPAGSRGENGVRPSVCAVAASCAMAIAARLLRSRVLPSRRRADHRGGVSSAPCPGDRPTGRRLGRRAGRLAPWIARRAGSGSKDDGRDRPGPRRGLRDLPTGVLRHGRLAMARHRPGALVIPVSAPPAAAGAARPIAPTIAIGIS